jgi:hypothetical protein
MWSGFPHVQCKFQEFCIHRLCTALCGRYIPRSYSNWKCEELKIIVKRTNHSCFRLWFADNISRPWCREEHRLQNCVLYRTSGIAVGVLVRKSVEGPLLHCRAVAKVEVSNWLHRLLSVPPSCRYVTICPGLVCSNFMQPKHTHAYSNTGQSNNVLCAGQHFLKVIAY